MAGRAASKQPDAERSDGSPAPTNASGKTGQGSPSAGPADSAVGEQERIRNEEYKIWKKQSPFLYDVCISKAVPSPATSVQWYPAASPYASLAVGDAPFDTYSLLLTASDSLSGRCSVYNAQVDLPSKQFATHPPTAEQRSQIRKIAPGLQLELPSSEPAFRARYNPHEPNLVATANRGGNAYVLDSKGSEAPRVLKHHKEDAFGVSWDPHSAQRLATSSADGTVAVWNLPDSTEKPEGVLVHGSGSGSVNCVEFAPLTQHELASAGDDRTIRFWDTRLPEQKVARQITDSHATAVTAMHYHPQNSNLLATGSADGVIAVWDVRMSSASLAGLGPGPASILALKWSPLDPSVLASGGADGHVKVWDLSLHGQEQTAAEEQEGPPELLFIHGGHLGNVLDLDWHPTVPWTIASVSEDSIAGVWRIASAIVDTDPSKN